MKASRLKSMLAMSALALAALSITGEVQAERVAASIGSARLGGERNCMRFDFGRVVNACSGPVLYNLTPRTITGSRTFRATALGGVGCRAIRLNGMGDFLSATPSVPIAADTTIGTMSIASGNSVIFECGIPPNAAIGSIDY